ncbi:MAG TPA: hypothetical protein VMZ91_00585 [Candidatus Paceibacterota bacterium]|nr:hypothetical protein [Candidatus Paceibacterota bacterium]
MTGKNKKMNFPIIRNIRLNKQQNEKWNPKRIRAFLEGKYNGVILEQQQIVEKLEPKDNDSEHFTQCKNKSERDFILHSRDAERFKKRYVKDHNGVWTDWYNTYTKSPEFRIPSLMTWKFFAELYHEDVICYRCGKKINNFNEYTPHHEEYEFRDDHLWHVFLEGDQKIKPCHTKKCHQKGNLKN